MKGKEFLDSKWVKDGAKPEAAQKIKAEFGRWATRVGNLGLLSKAKQLYGFFLSPEVSGVQKTLVAGALLYIISPLDLIPDVVPVLGWLDDIGVAGFALNYVFSKMNDVSSARLQDGDVLEAEIAGTKEDDVAMCCEIASRDEMPCDVPDLKIHRGRLDELATIAEKLAVPNIRDNVQRIADSVMCGRLMRVGFVGRYSTGKSTLLNSLIGKQLLPTSNLPSTKVLTYIMRGRRPGVFAQNCDDGSVSAISGLEVLLDDSADDAQVSAYAVTVPEFPYDDVVFVDTPGLQDTDSDTSQRTIDMVPELDAAVVLFDSNYLQAAAEFDFVSSMLMTDRNRKLFVVINKVEDKSREEVRRLEGLCRASLVECGASNARIFSVSAKRGTDDPGFVSFEKELRSYLNNEIRSTVIAHAEAEAGSCTKVLIGACEQALLAVGQDAATQVESRERAAVQLAQIDSEYGNQCLEIRKKLTSYRNRFFVDFSLFMDNLKASVRESILKQSLNDLKNTDAIAASIKGQIVKYVDERIEELNLNVKADIDSARCHIEKFLSGLVLPLDVTVRDLSQYCNLFVPVIVAASYVFCGFFSFVWCVIVAVVGRNFFESAIESFLKKFGVSSVRERLGDEMSKALDTAKIQLVDKLNESFDMFEDQIMESFGRAKDNAYCTVKGPELDKGLTAEDVQACHKKLISMI